MDPAAAEARKQRLLAKKKMREQYIIDNKSGPSIPAALAGFHHHEQKPVDEGKVEEKPQNIEETTTKPEDKQVVTEDMVPLKAREEDYNIIKPETHNEEEKPVNKPKTQEERRNEGYSQLNKSSKKKRKSNSREKFSIYTTVIVILLMIVSVFLSLIKMKKSILIIFGLDALLIFVPSILIFGQGVSLATAIQMITETMKMKKRYPYYFISIIFTLLLEPNMKNTMFDIKKYFP